MAKRAAAPERCCSNPPTAEGSGTGRVRRFSPETASRRGTTRRHAHSTAQPPLRGKRRCSSTGRTAPPAWTAGGPAGHSRLPAAAPGYCSARAPAWAPAPQPRRRGRQGTRRWRPACRAARRRRLPPLQVPPTAVRRPQKQRRALRWRGSVRKTPAATHGQMSSSA